MVNGQRLIDANALCDEVDKSKHNNPHPQGMIRVNHRNEHDHFIRMILDAPTVDAVEVVHARWENIKHFGGADCFGYCSNCKSLQKAQNATVLKGAYRFCRWCGAKMDGGNEDGS